MGCCYTRAQVRHVASVVFPAEFGGSQHVYLVHSINVQLVTDPVITPDKEEHECDSGSESLDKHEPSCIAMLKDVINVLLLRKGQNDRIKNIGSVFYGIQCSLSNLELSLTIMTNSSSDHNTSASKTVRLEYTLVRKTFPTTCGTHNNVHRQSEVKIGIHH